MTAITLVFVHGWSVTNLDTYGNLPGRLKTEGANNGYDIDIRDIFLGRYISFHDEVRLPDISRAFNAAIADQLAGVDSFVCITHSTGGPVVRDWWDRYCRTKTGKSNISHLIMLAPANFGSALAVLGKGTLSRLQSWFKNIEPGQGVLDWLCLGSAAAWTLNKEWIMNGDNRISPTGIFPFVLTGQSIDRAFYDALNAYTGELGSDGVVRVAAANLQATYISLEQPAPVIENGQLRTGELQLVQDQVAPLVPLRVLSRKSHSGKTMGIMASVSGNDEPSMETVNAIFACISVSNRNQYKALAAQFAGETAAVQAKEKVEPAPPLLPKRYFIHDRYTMVIFRVTDSEGYPLTDFDLLLTAGPDNDPNQLPEGFFMDRQQNKTNKNTITYFLNYDIMVGSEAVIAPDGKLLRDKTSGIDLLGIHIKPRPDAGFVRYCECRYTASKELFEKVLNPNSTTMIDIVLQRMVDKEVFRMEQNVPSLDFSDTVPSDDIAG